MILPPSHAEAKPLSRKQYRGKKNALREGTKGTDPGSFQSCPVTGPGGHTLKLRRLPLNVRKHFFPVQMTEHWQRLSRNVM